MIFVHGTPSTMLIFLTYQDVNEMKGTGRYRFVDPSHTGGATFDRVAISIARDHAAITDMMRQAGHPVEAIEALPEGAIHNPERPSYKDCEECGHSTPEMYLDEGRCMVCWKALAKRFHAELNGCPIPPPRGKP